MHQSRRHRTQASANNRIESHHRSVKRRLRAMQGTTHRSAVASKDRGGSHDNAVPSRPQPVTITISDASCSLVGPGRFQIHMEGTVNVSIGQTYLFYAEASNQAGGTRWRPGCKSWGAAVSGDGDLWNVSCVHRPNDPAETVWGTTNNVILANGQPTTSVYAGTISNGQKTGGSDRSLSCPLK